MDNSISESDLGKLTRFPLLTQRETVELSRRIAEGDERAFTRFMEGNLRLVIKWANFYSKNGAIETADAISEGCIGLMKAVRKFDPGKGFAFSTYATWWIRAEIQKALAQKARLIRIPDSVGADLTRIRRGMQELGFGLEDLMSRQQCERLCEQVPCTMEHLVDRLPWLWTPASLDARLGVADDGDFYALGYGSVSLDDRRVRVDDLISVLRRYLSELDARIVVLRLGLDGAEQRMWRTVAEIVGLSTTTVEARGNSALRRLRCDGMREVLCDS